MKELHYAAIQSVIVPVIATATTTEEAKYGISN